MTEMQKMVKRWNELDEEARICAADIAYEMREVGSLISAMRTTSPEDEATRAAFLASQAA
jgi:hypothetical protein